MVRSDWVGGVTDWASGSLAHRCRRGIETSAKGEVKVDVVDELRVVQFDQIPPGGNLSVPARRPYQTRNANSDRSYHDSLAMISCLRREAKPDGSGLLSFASKLCLTPAATKAAATEATPAALKIVKVMTLKSGRTVDRRLDGQALGFLTTM